MIRRKKKVKKHIVCGKHQSAGILKIEHKNRMISVIPYSLSESEFFDDDYGSSDLILTFPKCYFYY